MKKPNAVLLVCVIIAIIALMMGCVDNEEDEEMNEINSLLIYVNSGMDKPFNQYASLVMAFTAKTVYNVPEVTVFYGPSGVEMVKKGTLAQLPIDDGLKALVANQFENLNPEDLPDNLELLARFEKEQLGVNFASCATFHVVSGFATAIEDTSNVEDFITPLKIPDAVGAGLGADKIIFL
ncbi:unnamed protein product [marine sediment metagenome]|uniref:Uncharacterized protein n=1 Tax=marine sediment metagenome TaxID=412755 RepID=X1H866_9ZZZZ